MHKIMLIVFTTVQAMVMYGSAHNESKQSAPSVRHRVVKWYTVSTMRQDNGALTSATASKKNTKQVHFNPVIGSQRIIENSLDQQNENNR